MRRMRTLDPFRRYRIPIHRPSALPVSLSRLLSCVLACAALFVANAGAAPPPSGAPPAELRWGGDAEGGAPYVEADPADPSRVVGFDVEIAELIARQSGRTPEFVQVEFSSLDPSA